MKPWWGTALAMVATAAMAQDEPSASVAPKPVGIIGSTSGTGGSPAVAEAVASLPTHTVFRPRTLPAAPLPVVLWGNGACRDNGLQHAMFLREIASHGYYVIALGRPRFERGIEPREAAPATPPPPPPRVDRPDETQVSQMSDALSWASAENERAGGPLAGKLDLGRVAVMGHSCGGLQSIVFSADPRVKTTIIYNSGVYIRRTPTNRSGIEVGKDALDRLHAPIAYFHGGPEDIAYANAEDDVARIRHVPLFRGSLPVGHAGTFWLDPNGGAWAKVGAAWLDWQLRGDTRAAAMFSGKDCGLCTDPAWSVVRRGIR